MNQKLEKERRDAGQIWRVRVLPPEQDHPLEQAPWHVPAMYINWGGVLDIKGTVNFVNRGFCLGPRAALT